LADRKVGNVYVSVQIKDFHQPPDEVASSKTMNPSRDFAWAHGLARLGLGINIAVHGYTRLPNLAGFASHLTEQFAQSILPASLLYASGYAIAIGEAVIGTLLVLGVFLRSTLIAGALLMIVLIGGTCLIQDWDTAAIQMTYLAFYCALLAGSKFDCFSVSNLIGKS
jgi:thiosulfate dehydrogenase (quinone) large subunit